jgi:hypothetical protein
LPTVADFGKHLMNKPLLQKNGKRGFLLYAIVGVSPTTPYSPHFAFSPKKVAL